MNYSQFSKLYSYYFLNRNLTVKKHEVLLLEFQEIKDTKRQPA